MKCMVAGPECAAQTFVIVWPRVALIVDRRRTEFVAADRTHLNALPLPEAQGSIMEVSARFGPEWKKKGSDGSPNKKSWELPILRAGYPA